MITSFPFRIRRLIGEPETLARLKLSARNYILDLFGGPYDVDYVNARLRIGLVHKRIGVPPKTLPFRIQCTP